MLPEKWIVFYVGLFVLPLHAAIKPDQPPFGLSIEQSLEWHPDSKFADKNNVSRVALAQRFEEPQYQLNPNLNPNVKVLIAPDGMNNIGNYIQRQSKFNLYNFTHWAQIDVLNWFAGTADLTVNMPSRPWVEAAHRNGVKVIGTVYLAVARWGGSADRVATFLQRDTDGTFPMAKKLVQMAQYYGFDGWLMNQETDLTSIKDGNNQIVKGLKDYNRGACLGREMLAFMTYLTQIAPDGMEIHWYDAQLPDGRVAWQNELNDKNASFFGTRLQPASDAIFVNYWWDRDMVRDSHAYAKSLHRDPYDVYTGADLWPTRTAQRIFTETAWLDDIFSDTHRQGLTSIALFGNNINFPGGKSVELYSRFQEDEADYERFYDFETRLFSGDDLNAATHRHDAWKGISHYVPANSVLDSLPFKSNFSTGHGFFTAEGGEVMEHSAWHDLSKQDILPSWQFAVLGDPNLSVRFDFSQAYTGGNSLRVSGEQLKVRTLLPLFKTRFFIEGETLTVQAMGNTANASLLLDLTDGEQVVVPLNTDKTVWKRSSKSLREWQGHIVSRLSLVFEPGSQNSFELFLGEVSID